MKKPPRICFIHVPKCAGSSLNRQLKRALSLGPLNFRFSKVKSAKTLRQSEKRHIDVLEYRESALQSKLSRSVFRYVKGHSRCSNYTRSSFEHKWTFITVIRNPIDRWISEYFYNRYKPSHHRKIEMSLDDFIKSNDGIRNGKKYQDFFTSMHNTSEDRLVQEAIANLEKFHIVGVLEKPEMLNNELGRLLSQPFALNMVANTNPIEKIKIEQEISDDQKAEIHQLCKADMVIYNHFASKAQIQ